MPPQDQAELWKLAYSLAKSGNYQNSFFVEMELRSRGFDVSPIVNDSWARERITKMCMEAKEPKSNA